MNTSSLFLPLSSLLLLGAGCDNPTDDPDDLVQLRIPEDNPGPPFYARVTPVFNEFFRDGDWLAIPFYRNPDCIPPDFNLLSFYDFPSEAGAGAFSCELIVEGTAYTEPDSPPDVFPARVVMSGLGEVPVWFVPWSDLEGAISAGVLTLSELRALDPIVGAASTFEEDLLPRAENHRIQIESSGALDDGRAFRFDVIHVGESTEHIEISFE